MHRRPVHRKVATSPVVQTARRGNVADRPASHSQIYQLSSRDFGNLVALATRKRQERAGVEMYSTEIVGDDGLERN